METVIYKTVAGCEIKGDFYPVDKDHAPLVVFIHGGGLIWGTRDDIKKEQLKIYNDAGYNVFTIDYRLAPESKLPDIVRDVKDCLVWLHNEGKEQLNYDAERIAVVGGSAGGYLALFTGTFDIRPKAIVSFYGYGNILDDWYLKPSRHYNTMTKVPEQLAKQLIQNKPISSASIEQRFGIYLYCRQQGKWLDYVTGLDPIIYADHLRPFCPREQVDANFPPTLLLHGDKDEDVPYEESVSMAKALTEHQVKNELITIPNGKHTFDYNAEDPVVIDSFKRVIEFLNEHL